MAYTENTVCVSSEDDRGLLRSINYLKVIAAVVDELETVRKSHEAVMIGNGIDTQYFQLQDKLTDCFRQLNALKNINSIVKDAKENLTQRAQALQRIMDELCLQAANNTFAAGSSHAVHSESGSNDIGPSRMEKRPVNSIYFSNSSPDSTDRIIEQLENDPTGRLFQRPESDDNATYREIHEHHPHYEEEIVMPATGLVDESAEIREVEEIERAEDEIPASGERTGFLRKKSRRRHSNSQGSGCRKRGTVRKFFRKFTICFRGHG